MSGVGWWAMSLVVALAGRQQDKLASDGKGQ